MPASGRYGRLYRSFGGTGSAIVCNQDIYGEDRPAPLQAGGAGPEAGAQRNEGGGTEVQFMWWNSESQSTGGTAMCAPPCCLEDPVLRKKADGYIDRIPCHPRTEDGYLGIYGTDLRYRHTTENGELWSKSTLYRVLLGYYEATGEQRVKDALVRAFDNLMEGYPMGSSDPFLVDKSFLRPLSRPHHCGRVGRNVRAHRGRKVSGLRGVALWERYSANEVEEEDLTLSSIRNPHYFWKNHGVHLYEHLRAVILAASRKAEYRPLLELVRAKLPYYLTPSGGPIGDEWVNRRTANASRTGYEFCSVTELFDSLRPAAGKDRGPLRGRRYGMAVLQRRAGHEAPHGKLHYVL